MPGRIFLINVGANASHRFAGPVFQDGTFEFLPIPEDDDLVGPHILKYRDLLSYNDRSKDLKPYVPLRLWDWPAHADPEFETFTYGDNCDASPRAASLKTIEVGDYLFFIARLVNFELLDKGSQYGFYLLGFFEIESILCQVKARPNADALLRFEANSHVRRGLCSSVYWNGFWVFGGSAKSRRFRKALPVNRQLADKLFTTANGTSWHWDKRRTELQVIGSYTRSCRCVIDPSKPGHNQRLETLWQMVNSETV